MTTPYTILSFVYIPWFQCDLSLVWASCKLSTESTIFVIFSVVVLFLVCFEDILFSYFGVYLEMDGSALLQDMGLCFFYLTAFSAKDVMYLFLKLFFTFSIWVLGLKYYIGFISGEFIDIKSSFSWFKGS